MKILFLDIDGVLNTDSFRREFGDRMNPYLVNNLISVIVATGSKIVISSDWRFGGIGYSSDIYNEMFCKGFLDVPSKKVVNNLLSKIIDSTLDIGDRREIQILEWVGSHTVDKWVAVDDLELDLPSENFLQTYDDRGLNEQATLDLILKLK